MFGALLLGIAVVYFAAAKLGLAMAFVAPSTVHAPNPDNRVRAMLPDAGRVAEVLFGDRLPPRSRR